MDSLKVKNFIILVLLIVNAMLLAVVKATACAGTSCGTSPCRARWRCWRKTASPSRRTPTSARAASASAASPAARSSSARPWTRF
ncbi:MAG: hypothetical protein ACLUEK_13280 [Oscillospiraceae bacterium]